MPKRMPQAPRLGPDFCPTCGCPVSFLGAAKIIQGLISGSMQPAVNVYGPELRLLEHLSPSGWKGVWRAVALDLHPDRHGGDARAMAQATEAWREIQERIK